MTPPRNQWLKIFEYREFHDFPRFVLAIDPAENYWILDARFDDDLDDYAKDYSIFSAGTSADEAADLFDRIGKLLVEASPVDRHPSRMAAFDETKRKQVLLKE